MQVPVYNMQGEQISETDLRDDIFDVPVNVGLMHQALVRQLANARLGTHKTKTRGEVIGGGRKPWRQKGTGRARQGSIRSPQWRGGGTVFGPTPRSYRQKMPRKMRRQALRSALSVKAADSQLKVLDALEMNEPRTKQVLEILRNLDVDTTALLLLPGRDEVILRSVRNLPQVRTLVAQYLNVRDLLKFEFYFPDKHEFAAEVGEEVSGVYPRWVDAIEAGNALAVVQAFRPHLADWVLRPFVEAYRVVADVLERYDYRQEIDRKELLAECLALGRQYRLQRKIESPESVSTVLFDVAFKLAANRRLLDPGGPEQLERRRAFAAEIREVLRRMDALAALAAAKRAGLQG